MAFPPRSRRTLTPRREHSALSAATAPRSPATSDAPESSTGAVPGGVIAAGARRWRKDGSENMKTQRARKATSSDILRNATSGSRSQDQVAGSRRHSAWKRASSAPRGFPAPAAPDRSSVGDCGAPCAGKRPRGRALAPVSVATNPESTTPPASRSASPSSAEVSGTVTSASPSVSCRSMTAMHWSSRGQGLSIVKQSSTLRAALLRLRIERQAGRCVNLVQRYGHQSETTERQSSPNANDKTSR
jgi:hypothetical protein